MTNETVQDAFSTHYAQARAKFLAAAQAAQLPIKSYAHPLAGLHGESLALDVALDGPPNARKIAIVSSAVHGVEGFCGSGIQVHALRDPSWREPALGGNDYGVAVLYLHAVKPWASRICAG